MIERSVNPIIDKNQKDENIDIAIDMTQVRRASYRKRKFDQHTKKIAMFREETARIAIFGLGDRNDIYGLTKGQFSLVELIEAMLDITGVANVFISSWVAGRADIAKVIQIVDSGKISTIKLLLDSSFQRRDPGVMQMIIKNFGLKALRVTKNHAKFVLIENEDWKISCSTSMNLNKNFRFEFFSISNDTELFAFLKDIVESFFKQTGFIPSEENQLKSYQEFLKF